MTHSESQLPTCPACLLLMESADRYPFYMGGGQVGHMACVKSGLGEYQPIREAMTRSPLDAGPLTFGFADPPYPGQAKRHYGNHPDYAGEVDHAQLIDRLMSNYPDGWALCSSSGAIPMLAPAMPQGIRVLAWTKSLTSYKPGVAVDYGWEPIYLWGGRRRRRSAPMLRDWLYCHPARHRGRVDHAGESDAVIGMKPVAFCTWIFECLGARPDLGDTLVDLFPGSGAVSGAWDRWAAQGRLAI